MNVKNGKVVCSLPFSISLDSEICSGLHFAMVDITTVSTDDGLKSISCEQSLADPEHLDDIKKKFGDDTVTSFKSTADNWICVCGHINPTACGVCAFCDRSLSQSSSIGLAYFLEKAKQMASTKEILALWDSSDISLTPETMVIYADLKKMVDFERFYGPDVNGIEQFLRKLE